MTPLQVAVAIFAIVASISTLVAVLAKVGAYVMESFHAEHVQPAVKDLSHAIARSTEATTGLTAALARTDATQRDAQTANASAFTGIKEWLSDHEHRIGTSERDIAEIKGRRTPAIRPKRTQ